MYEKNIAIFISKSNNARDSCIMRHACSLQYQKGSCALSLCSTVSHYLHRAALMASIPGAY